MTVEHEFESRYEVVKWMLDRQLDRRSPNKKKRTYVIGRRYLVEKNENGGDRKSVRQNGGLIGETSKRIADQLSMGFRTVERAAEFTLAVEKVPCLKSKSFRNKLFRFYVQPRMSVPTT